MVSKRFNDSERETTFYPDLPGPIRETFGSYALNECPELVIRQIPPPH